MENRATAEYPATIVIDFTCAHTFKEREIVLRSFTIAGALRTKAEVICARSKENVSVFRYFMMST